MVSDARPIVVEQTYSASLDVVWSAITDSDHMRQWFFEEMQDLAAEPGFETEFSVECEGRHYVHLWKVTEVVAERRIGYDWCYGGCPGSSTVLWELSEQPSGTQLKLTHVGHESFPQDDPAFSRESCQGGWGYFLHDRLKAFLERP